MTTDPLLQPVHCVSNNLHKTARAVSRLYAEVMRPAGLARSQFAVLSYLEQAGPLAMGDLAERLYLERTTLTRNLKPLLDAGWVVREPSATDARIKQVVITDSGRAKLAEARVYWQQAQARMIERFGAEAWRELEATLRELRRLAG